MSPSFVAAAKHIYAVNLDALFRESTGEVGRYRAKWMANVIVRNRAV